MLRTDPNPNTKHVPYNSEVYKLVRRATLHQPCTLPLTEPCKVRCDVLNVRLLHVLVRGTQVAGELEHGDRTGPQQGELVAPRLQQRSDSEVSAPVQSIRMSAVEYVVWFGEVLIPFVIVENMRAAAIGKQPSKMGRGVGKDSVDHRCGALDGLEHAIVL